MAEDIGGRVQPGSGAPKFYKSDVRKMGQFRGECKTTSKLTYTLQLKDLEKLQTEALQGGFEMPVLQVEFRNGGVGKRYAVIDYARFTMMIPSYNKFLIIIPLEVEGKTAKLSLTELIRIQAMTNGDPANIWAMHVCFMGTKRFAVTGWETFMELYEKTR